MSVDIIRGARLAVSTERREEYKMTSKLRIYTDGACKGNPGPGGWGAILEYGDHQKELCGGEPETTNNRMELMAVIEALSALTRPCELDLYTDSKYVMQGIQEWMPRWKQNGWQTANKKAVKNDDLWRQLDQLVSTHNVHVFWVKGHSGHPGNERADALANEGIDRMQNKDV